MPYEIVQPPFSLNFHDMTRKELDAYFRWFIAEIPVRLEKVAQTVRESKGFESWHADETPESLDALGEWFVSQVAMRQRTETEGRRIAAKALFQSATPGEELTDRTFSLAFDVGIYFSRVLLANWPVLKWSHVLGNKRSVDYGQPVVVAFSVGPLNPVQVMVTLAYGIAKETRDGPRLRQLYNYWSTHLSTGG